MPSFIRWEPTLQEVLTGIPRDPAGTVVYLMLALFVGFIVCGSLPGAGRRGGSGGGAGDVQ